MVGRQPPDGPSVEWAAQARVYVERFRASLGDRRFWITQALVLGISVAHTVLEATRHSGLLHDLELLPVSMYFIPVVYAGLNFGVEGAVPTAFWSALLTLPNLILWHTAAQRPGVLLQLALLVVLAYVIARRVDAETAAKERAEAANARLERLNRTAAASARSLDLGSVIAETLHAMIEIGTKQIAWVSLTSHQGGGTWTSGSSQADADAGGRPPAFEVTPAALRRWGDSCVAGASELLVEDDGSTVAPLHVAGALVGVLGVLDFRERLSADELRLLQAVASQLSVALGNIRYVREVERMVAELSCSQAALQEYVRLATDAQEEERKRLARELHDDTIQSLVIAKAELEALTLDDQLPSDVRTRSEKVEAMLARTVDNVRRFSRDLRPSLLDDLGLVHAIDWLVSDLGARTGCSARFRTSGTLRRLSPKDELTLFRIVQEALRNAERHASASSVRVRLRFGPDIRVVVVDNGKGFAVDGRTFSRREKGGLGLLGMRERAKLAHAELAVASRPALGTRVVVTLTPPA